jgi:membrane protease YdiL (CAAX protease family)
MTATNRTSGFYVSQVITRTKILTIFEILLVFAVLVALRVALRSTSVVQWEGQNLGWSYGIPLLWIGIIVLVMRLTHRSWAEYGVSTADWRTGLDIGMKAYLVRFIPIVIGTGGAFWLGLSGTGSLAYRTLISVIALALMVWVINRQKEVKSGRSNVIVTVLLLLVPVGVALAMGQLSLVIVSTVVWQFVFSGFGEEFIFRGYFQSRLNQAFGRPMRLFGIQFGPGLIVAALLFGLLHAFNGYDPAVGFSSLNWDWALSSALGGLFFGVIREKTGNLLAPGIAHGLPDAVGEPLIMILGWGSIF